MDANKLTILRSINFPIPPHCGICVHSDLSADGWGICQKHSYAHLKHSAATSQLSIHTRGSCGSFELDHSKAGILGLHAFVEFLPQPPEP